MNQEIYGYFSVGSHEGYYCPDGIGEYYVEFYHDDQPVDCTKYVSFANRTSKEIFMDGNHLELEDSYFEDDLLVFKNITFDRVVLGHKKNKRRIELAIENGEYFLIWSKSGAHFVCLEPWYGIQRWGCTDENYDFDSAVALYDKIISISTSPEKKAAAEANKKQALEMSYGE